MKVARQADAVLVTYAKITADMIRQMSRCRIIARFGIGVDNVDIAAATDAGIVVTRVPDYCVDEVSDHTMALLLALVRKIPFANSLVTCRPVGNACGSAHSSLAGNRAGSGRFRENSSVGGAQGKSFRHQSCGLRSLCFKDPSRAPQVLSRSISPSCSRSPIMCPFILRSLPETHHLFNADVFAQMKPTAYLINTARGPIVDEAALAHALDTGRIAGAALDVLSSEPPLTSPLFGRDNVILTPHMSFYSVESLIELQTKAAEEVVRVLTGQMPR